MSWFGGKKKEKQKQYSGFPGDCSEEQLQVLSKFKLHIEANNKIPIEQFDEIYLLRFLRARKFDMPKTIKMWDDFIDWRVKNNIENYKEFKFPQLIELRKLYPHGYHKVDKQFRPVYIERVGFMDVDKIFKVMNTQNMLQYYSVLYQTLLTTIFDGCTKAKELATGQHNRVTQTVTILDLKHIKLGNASKAYDFVKPVSAMAQNNYPQILGNMFIINAPMLFTGIWAMVKMWIDDKTKDKIKIFGSSYKKELLQYIDPENLPAFLDGGKCTCDGKECKLEANVGPWNPEGNEMFYNNINLINAPTEHKGYHKEQVLLSSPDVLVEIQVKNDAAEQLPPVITQSMQHGSQQDQVLKKVKQIDLGQDVHHNFTEPQQQLVTEGTQTEQKKEAQAQQVKEVQPQQTKKIQSGQNKGKQIQQTKQTYAEQSKNPLIKQKEEIQKHKEEIEEQKKETQEPKKETPIEQKQQLHTEQKELTQTQQKEQTQTQQKQEPSADLKEDTFIEQKEEPSVEQKTESHVPQQAE